MGFLEAVIVSVAFALVLKFLYPLIDMFRNRKEKENHDEWLKFGLLSVKDLHDLEPIEFEQWCADYLERQGYSNVEVTPEKTDGGKDIICWLGSKKFYVECKRYLYNENAEFRVTRDIVQKLVGAMVGDNVQHGIIITTGIITPRSYEYAEALPKNIDIELIDGIELINRFRKLRYREIDMQVGKYYERSS
jgi:restriction system protein